MKENKTVTKMSDRRKAIKEIYGSDDGLRIKLNKSASGISGSNFNEETLNRAMQQVSVNGSSIKDIVELSRYAYSTEGNYSKLIDYLANMFLWRYYYIPTPKKLDKKGDYKTIYQEMTQVVDGISIETTFPIIITKLLKEGVVYLYTMKDNASKTVSTVMLNPMYCKPIGISQYGTGIFKFDMKYFDGLSATNAQLEEVLELFPPEIAEGYREYKKAPSTDTQHVVLDGKYATYIQLNDTNFPTYLTALRSVFDYNTYRKNEVEKSTSQLDMVLAHKIPSYEDQLLFELPEVTDLHKSMSKSLSAIPRLKLLTTFGDSEILKTRPESNVENKVLEKAYEAIYQTSGLNPNLFNGATEQALKYSIKRDKSVMWSFVQKLVNFYNLSINNLFNFKEYQLELNMLPITHYDDDDQLSLLRKNAEYGVGRLELIVASGTKQRHIAPKAELEEYLDLENILKPLKSSHTVSRTEEETQPEAEKEKGVNE